MINKCYTKFSVKFKLVSLVILVCFSFLSSGCAAIFNGSSQTVNINTDPEGATIVVGSQRVISPASLELKREQNYFIKAKKDGYNQAYMPINKQLSGWFWCGLLLWGVFECISLGTGGAYKLKPDDVLIYLGKEKPEKATDYIGVPSPKIKPAVQIQEKKSLEDIEEKLIRLERMKAKGLITEEEYSEMRVKILEQY